jgi:hypothetical protein
MLKEEIEQVRQIVKEEIAAAMETIKPTAKVKIETPEPAVEEVHAEAPKKGMKEK